MSTELEFRSKVNAMLM